MTQPTPQNHAKKSHWLVVALVLGILGAGIGALTLHLRSVIRHEILQQDGQVLYAASLTDQFGQSQLDLDLQEVLADDPEAAEELSFLLEPEEQLLTILEASKLRGVFAVRLYREDGSMLSSFPPGLVQPATLSPPDLEALAENAPLTELHPAASLLDYMQDQPFEDPPRPAPVLRVLVPLRKDTGFSGAAEFILDGKNVADAFASVDRDLIRYGLLIFLVGGAVIATALVWAFRRLEKSNALLTQRTQSLLRANHELTLAAKTSAVGAITAHLIHDLKNPLFGLESFVSLKGSAGLDDEDWNMAISTTQRMQKLIGDVVKILQQENSVAAYELSVEELLSLLQGKLAPAALEAGVELRMQNEASGVLSNKDANMILLIATNLLQNALQSTPRDGQVGARAYRRGGEICFDFFDTGPGLPQRVQETLFTPCRSTKAGGTGLGLAISRQLAAHLGADLTLLETGPAGTTFQLRVPEQVLVDAADAAAP